MVVVSSFQRGVKELEDVTINESLRVVLFVIEDIKVEMQKSTAQYQYHMCCRDNTNAYRQCGGL